MSPQSFHSRLRFTSHCNDFESSFRLIKSLYIRDHELKFYILSVNRMGYLGTYRDVGLTKMDIIVILKSIANKALLFDQALVAKNHQSIFSFSDDLPRFLTTYNPKSYFNDYCNERISEFEKKLRARLMTPEELAKDQDVSFPRKELTRNDKYFKQKDFKDYKGSASGPKEQGYQPPSQSNQPRKTSQSPEFKNQHFESRDQKSTNYPQINAKDSYRQRDPRFSSKGAPPENEVFKPEFKERQKEDALPKPKSKERQRLNSSRSSSSSKSSSNHRKRNSRSNSSHNKDRRRSSSSSSSSRRSTSSNKSNPRLPRQRKQFVIEK